jgi:hypothetical protein
MSCSSSEFPELLSFCSAPLRKKKVAKKKLSGWSVFNMFLYRRYNLLSEGSVF